LEKQTSREVSSGQKQISRVVGTAAHRGPALSLSVNKAAVRDHRKLSVVAHVAAVVVAGGAPVPAAAGAVTAAAAVVVAGGAPVPVAAGAVTAAAPAAAAFFFVGGP